PPANVPAATRTVPVMRSVPSPESLMPRGGMRGTLSIDGAASASAGHVLISFGQCQPCHDGGSRAGSGAHHWQATTTDAGASWHVVRTSLALTTFAFAGADGWAEGTGTDSVLRFFASHDGGLTWHPAGPAGVGNVSIAGGEVWSLGCAGNACDDTVLRGLASGNHLAETSTEPPLSDTTNVSVAALSRDRAYVLADDYGTGRDAGNISRTRLFGTNNGGATWRSEPAPCPHRTFGHLYAGGTQSLWVTCEPRRGLTELRRSSDGGARWTTPLAARANSGQLQPASAQVAWATTPDGQVLRTADGGRTWTRVWYGGRPEATAPTNAPPVNRSWGEVLAVQSPTTATVIAQVTRRRTGAHATRTDFVSYRSTDGGRTWAPTVVRLPAG
ncbi:MAG: hypothetical protein ACRDPM_16325, partial [Solirubrobacteraceae bacterium]